MKFKELFALAASGATVTVECREGVLRWEGCYPNPGIRFDVESGKITEPDVGQMLVSYSNFDEFNKAFESHDYGKNNLTAREAGYYKLRESIYVDPEEDISEYLEIVGDERKRLLLRYAALPEPKPSYVGWLESLVLTSIRE